MGEPRSYEQAQAKASTLVWPGCGDGRCMPCGRVHNFDFPVYGGMQDRFRCYINYTRGCPQPKKKPEHDWHNGKCKKCRVEQGWGYHGKWYRTIASAKRAGIDRAVLARAPHGKHEDCKHLDEVRGPLASGDVVYMCTACGHERWTKEQT